MSTPSARAERSRARARARRSRAAVRWAVRLAILAVVFFAGLAIGRTLEETPRPGGSQTLVRTLEPLTIAPAERTVTVTTVSP